MLSEDIAAAPNAVARPGVVTAEQRWQVPAWTPVPPRPMQLIAARRRVVATTKLRAWHPIALMAMLVFVTLVFGTLGIGAIRPLFVLACVGLSAIAWKVGAPRHIELTLILFMISPFLRRIVDLHAGYDTSGIMLIGPLLFILVPVIDLRVLLRPPGDGGSGSRAIVAYAPVLLFLLCSLWASVQSIVVNDYMSAATGALKNGAPALYGIWLTEQARKTDGLLRAATRVFAVLAPVMGIYGFLQYINPPDWDRYWMNYAGMTSIGNAAAFEVRVFSTMNAPASLATYLIAGMVMFGFCWPGWIAALLALPSCLGLMLSLYRTAWGALAAGVLFALLFSTTRLRALLIISSIACGIVVAIAVTPFGDVIADRLETLNAPQKDGSGQERMQEFVTLWNSTDSVLWGTGFGIPDVGSPGKMPVDGLLVANWLSMGIVMGLLCVAATIGAAVQALMRVRASMDRDSVVLGAIIVGALFQIPLANITAGELGLLFWMAIALTNARYLPSRNAPRIPPGSATAVGSAATVAYNDQSQLTMGPAPC